MALFVFQAHRVLRPGILWPGSGQPAPPRSSARPAVRAWLPWIRKTPRSTPASRAVRCRNAAPPVALCRAGSLRRRCSCTAGWRPSSTMPRRRLPRLPYLQRPGAIAAAVARAACRLTPVTRTRRIPALTGAGMFAAYAASICPAAGVLSPLAFRIVPGYGPRRALDFRPNAKPCLAERRSFKVQENSHVQKIIDCRPGARRRPQLLWAHAHRNRPAKDAVLAKTPATVTLTLTEGLEAAFSSLTLQDAAGKTVPTENRPWRPVTTRRWSCRSARICRQASTR